MLSDGAKLCAQANNLQDGINGDDKQADAGLTSVAISLFFELRVFAVIMSRRKPSKRSMTEEAVERERGPETGEDEKRNVTKGRARVMLN